MSPLPSPTPLRRTLLRVMFSPAGLLCGFVVLLIVTCPGARGDEAISLLLANGGLNTATKPATLDQFSVTPAVARPIGRSPRFDRVPASAARSKTPAERAAESGQSRAVGGVDHAGSTLPLLVDPLPVAGADRPVSAGLVPMTGPAVGIRPKLPGSGR